jgi:hypothetical protein
VDSESKKSGENPKLLGTIELASAGDVSARSIPKTPPLTDICFEKKILQIYKI